LCYSGPTGPGLKAKGSNRDLAEGAA